MQKRRLLRNRRDRARLVEIEMRPAGHIENGVMFGSDGYLFLLDGGHHVFDLLLGLRKVAEQSYANFADNISRRAAICQRADVGYLHVIYPNKHAVLTEQFPVTDPFRLAKSSLDRSAELRERVFYPRPLLQPAKPAAFLKTDTHLTEMANVLATGAIVQRLIGESQTEHVHRVLTFYKWGESVWTGDLGGRIRSEALGAATGAARTLAVQVVPQRHDRRQRRHR